MSRILLLLTGLVLALPAGPRLTAGDVERRCLQEVSQKLLRLERHINELETLLLKPHPSPDAHPSAISAQIEGLEKQIGELEQLIRQRVAQVPRPPPAAAQEIPRPSPSTRRRVELPRRVPSTEPRMQVTLSTPKESAVSAAGTFSPGNSSFCAKLRLRSKPDIPSPVSSQGPNFFGVFTYDVLDGPAAGETIKVAHGVRWGGRSTCVTTRKIGTELVLDVVPLWWYPEFGNVAVLGDSSGETIYIPRLH